MCSSAPKLDSKSKRSSKDRPIQSLADTLRVQVVPSSNAAVSLEVKSQPKNLDSLKDEPLIVVSGEKLSHPSKNSISNFK